MTHGSYASNLAAGWCQTCRNDIIEIFRIKGEVFYDTAAIEIEIDHGFGLSVSRQEQVVVVLRIGIVQLA